MSRQARHHASPRRRNHARDDGRARTHQRLRRGGQLPACRQGIPPPATRWKAQEDPAGTGYRNTDGPGHRFTEKPKYLKTKTGKDRHQTEQPGMPTPNRIPTYPKYRLRSNGPYDARDLHDLFRRSHLPSRDGRGSSAMFRRTRPADPFCCGWSGSAPVSGAVPRSDR